MKHLAIIALVVLSAAPAAWGFGNDPLNRYDIERSSPIGSNGLGSTDIEMRQRFNYDPATKFRGEIDNDGSVRMRNFEGERLRGNIDDDGYGRLRDQDGNTYRVRPRF